MTRFACCDTTWPRTYQRQLKRKLRARLSGTPTSRLARYLSGNSLFRTEPFVVDRFNLYTSRLHHTGATYTVETTYLLDQAP